MLLYRILVFVILLLAAAALPPPLAIAVSALFAFLFYGFWEAAVVGIFLDSLYSVPEPRWFGFQFVYTASAILAVFLIEMLKKQIRFYND
jgi:predicted membrane channel-forming protein YqfA (hemolysin III family)